VNTNFNYLLTISVVTALGGLLFGFDISVISGTIPFIQEYFGLTETMKGWMVSSALIGCIIGASFAGRLGDVHGRKKILLLTSLLFAVSAIGTALTQSIPSFIFYRILGGLAVGGASVLAPMYIAEVSPAHLRGRMVSINQLTIVTGISLAYYSNYFLLAIGENAWRWMFAAEAVPAMVFMVSLIMIPESPRWLVARKREDEALAILKRIDNSRIAVEELREIQQSLEGVSKRAVLKDLLLRKYRFIILIGIFLAVFQQWSGINVIFFYAPDIFAKARLGIDDALFQTTLIGVINIVFTLIAMRVIDRIGRKVMMLIGSAGMAISFSAIGLLFFTGRTDGMLMIAALLITPAFFAFGLGPTVWVVISEIFPNKIRGVAMSVATFALWSACYLLTLTFPVFVEKFSAASTFILYAVICLIGVVIIYKYIPETKGVSLEELERKLTI
jgi:MFS transporter, SP family, arabinose:H+ symporter